jgi:GNAT superfamily N-acetyltransferase
VELRRIRPGEHALAGEVCVAAYEPFLLGAEDFYRERLRDVARRDAEAEVWVAVDDDVLLGCVTHCPPGSRWREIGEAHEGEFRMLAVHPDARGRGIGTALSRLCEDMARDHGATAMVLSSLAAMTGAHRIYARLGYSRAEGRDWSPAPDVHLLAFTKPL